MGEKMTINTTVNLAGVELKNPVMTASGTFGSGQEYGELIDLNRLGAVVTKGVANVPWPGNPVPRIAETHGGMLNAIGLQNPGIDLFCKRDIPFLRQFDTKIIVNVCGRTTEDYLEVVERLGESGGSDYEGGKGKGETAGYYETESQCDRYHGDGESGGGRRRRCAFPD